MQGFTKHMLFIFIATSTSLFGNCFETNEKYEKLQFNNNNNSDDNIVKKNIAKRCSII